MLAIAGGILIAIGVISALIFGGAMFEIKPACGCLILSAVAAFVLFVIF